MKKTVIGTLAVVFLLGMSSFTALAQEPLLPHAFFGNLSINGKPAPAGTVVEARGPGVITGVNGNPRTTTEAGVYARQGPNELKLIVQGKIEEGTTLSFFVNGVAADQTAPWRSGQITRLDLTVTTGTPASGDNIAVWLAPLAAGIAAAAAAAVLIRRRTATKARQQKT